MVLAYKTKQTVKEKKTLVVPSKWGMFTKRGNKRMTEIAQEAADRVEKLVDEAKYRPSRNSMKDELERMFRKYKRLWDTKTYPESGDTSVRNSIRSFGERLAKAAGFGYESISIEESAYWAT